MPTPTPLDDVEFLAASPNRVTVLQALAADAHTRTELYESTGISRPTLGRVLEGFERRGWIVKSGRRYEITRLGALLADEFGRLLKTVETIQQLAKLEPRLPTDCMEFDFRLFADATITVPHAPDVFAHIRRVEELTQNAAEVHYVTQNVYLDSIPEQRTLILDHGQRQEIIISEAAFSVLFENSSVADIVRELLATDNMTLYLYRGPLPVAIGLLDDVATILPYDDQDFPCALIETRNETIRDWVTAMIDDYRAHAELLTPERLSELAS
ncbi:hypothetical protein AUR64_01780 [Haloprofundus marisrubri]|uniref:Transcriptional regulator n=1 Tax=Haloprofundus marisrubri TaxID=1514971 RepID=A0A0W1R4C8_9EURY|nr:hypothetical protein [Haloprofundus marisrubri]KTG07986.1 hypothetical protein AUR64_01780 [Haloprofundus marisrubri]